MKTNFIRWTCPILGQEAETAYSDLYGDDGQSFLRVLGDSPYEIAVLSRLIAYLANANKCSEGE